MFKIRIDKLDVGLADVYLTLLLSAIRNYYAGPIAYAYQPTDLNSL